MATFPSPLPVLLPDSAQLDVESLNFTDEAIVMIAGASGADKGKCLVVQEVPGSNRGGPTINSHNTDFLPRASEKA